ncbi:response regulator [Paenibacillus algorifonticola]|uniref:response regulator n=1 Tax=Paenibacillus algorifonticola TaxID=684063 RepID=UPI003D295F76
MLNMLIVDDESFVIEGLKHAVDWSLYGIRIAGEANNGAEALELLDTLDKPIDIIMTDVRMPIMDGFGLIERLNERGHRCKIIVLTGHEEFDYAKKAIRYRIFEYLLKPVTLDKIEETVSRLSAEFREENEKQRRLHDMEKKLQQSLPLLEERFYFNLLSGIYQQDMQALLGIKLHAAAYQTIIVQIDNLKPADPSAVHTADIERQRQLLSLTIQHMVSESLAEHLPLPFSVVVYNSTDFVLLLQHQAALPTGSEGEGLQPPFSAVQDLVQRETGLTVSFAIGRAYDSLQRVAKSFHEAQEALKHKLYYGNGCIVSYSDIEVNQGHYLDSFRQAKDQLVDAIQIRDAKLSTQVLSTIQSTLEKEKKYGIPYIRTLSMELVLIASLVLHEKGDHLADICPGHPDLLGEVQQLGTVADIFDTLRAAYTAIIQHYEQKGASRNRDIIHFVRTYMAEHLDQEIKLDDLAQLVYLTPNYLGYLFKETVGMGFSSYLMQLRMEHAKTLLTKPGSRIYEVAASVGYKNAHYFSKIFKEYTGVTPSEY